MSNNTGKWKFNFDAAQDRWRVFNADAGPLKQHALVVTVVITVPCRLAVDDARRGWLFAEGELQVAGDVAMVV